MENPSQFHLKQALHDWREQLAGSPALNARDLDELECHLRDSVAALESKGLSPHEAFWVARTRLGTTDDLDREFGKVNPQQVWLHRVLWMVIGSLCIGTLSMLAHFFSGLAVVAAGHFLTSPHLLGVFGLAIHFMTLCGGGFLIMRSGACGNGLVWQFARWTRSHPIITVGCLCFLVLLAVACLTLNNLLFARMLSQPTIATLALWRYLATWVPSLLFWPMILGWLLIRTARKPSFSQK